MMLAIGLIFGLALFLRGGQLHNFLVLEAEKICQQVGWRTQQEAPQQLPDGGLDFIDLLVQRGDLLLCLEIETSARNAQSNAHKAEQLSLPLVVIVPTRKVQRAVRHRLAKVHAQPGNQCISILLLSQLAQVLTNYFPLISAVSDDTENRKTNERRQK